MTAREQFVRDVFARDGGKCVVCGEPAVDAHHLIDRALWEDGGYHRDNGVSLCGRDHLRAEQTLISCEELRERAGIKTIVLPDHMAADERYDKWGNPIISRTTRLRGELFYEPNVQKVLVDAGVLADFLPWTKYPRTLHLPGSPGMTDDDKVIKSLAGFEGEEVVVTAKMDGENCLDEASTISTPGGAASIEALCRAGYRGFVRAFDTVTGNEVWDEVVGTSILPPNDDWFDVELEDGRILRVTGNHRLWIPEEQCYRAVRELRGDEVVLLEQP